YSLRFKFSSFITRSNWARSTVRKRPDSTIDWVSASSTPVSRLANLGSLLRLENGRTASEDCAATFKFGLPAATSEGRDWLLATGGPGRMGSLFLKCARHHKAPPKRPTSPRLASRALRRVSRELFVGGAGNRARPHPIGDAGKSLVK